MRRRNKNRMDKSLIITIFLVMMIFLSVVSMAMYYMSDHSAPSTKSRAERVEQANSTVQKDIQESKKREKAESTQIILPEAQVDIDHSAEQPKNETMTSKNVIK